MPSEILRCITTPCAAASPWNCGASVVKSPRMSAARAVTCMPVSLESSSGGLLGQLERLRRLHSYQTGGHGFDRDGELGEFRAGSGVAFGELDRTVERLIERHPRELAGVPVGAEHHEHFIGASRDVRYRDALA